MLASIKVGTLTAAYFAVTAIGDKVGQPWMERTAFGVVLLGFGYLLVSRVKDDSRARRQLKAEIHGLRHDVYKAALKQHGTILAASQLTFRVDAQRVAVATLLESVRSTAEREGATVADIKATLSQAIPKAAPDPEVMRAVSRLSDEVREWRDAIKETSGYSTKQLAEPRPTELI